MPPITTVMKFFICLCVSFVLNDTAMADGSTFYKVINLITGEERLEEHRHEGEKITVINTATRKVLYTSSCFNARSLCVANDETTETTINHIDKVVNLKNRETIRSMVFVKPKEEASLIVIGITITMVHEQDKKWVMVKSQDNTTFINTLLGRDGDYRRPDYTEHVIVNPDSGLPISHEISTRTDIEI